jgi:hypothetical protein
VAYRRSHPLHRRRVALSFVALLVALLVVYPVGYALVVPEERGVPIAIPPVPDGSYRIFVVDWGYHTAIVVPRPAGFALGPAGEEAAPYVEYAWGDRRFYMESRYAPWSVLATLALPTESVLYVDGQTDPPRFGGARGIYSRVVDAPTLARLILELERSVRRAPSGGRVTPHAMHGGYAGRFYPALGAYLWTRNCNWWTVERLLAAGLATSSRGVVFSGQVAGRLARFEVVSTLIAR